MCATSKSSSSPKSSNDTYEGISFQGNTGSLLLTTEKLVFRQKSETTCSQRTWLWSSIKKNNLVAAQDSKEDATPETRVIKISNHNHKAVSFQVPAGVAEKLQNDMTNHMVAAQELKKKVDEELQEEEVEEQQQQQPQPQRPVKTRKKVPRCYTSDEKLTRAMQLAKQAKDANQAQVKASYSHTTESMMDADAAKKIPKPSKTMRRAKSVDDTPMDNSSSKRSSLGGSLRSSVPLSGSIHSSSVRSRNGGAFRRSCPQPKTGRPGSPTSACIKGKNGKQQGTLLQHTGMIAQDLFLKPSQQMAHDFVVRPANNLIVKGTKRNIIDPAQEKIIKPTQEKIIKPTQEKIIKPAQEKTKGKIIKPAQDNILKPAQEKIIKPAQEKIVKPTQQVASNILNPPKVIAQDMGLLSTRSRHGDDAPNGSPTQATKKKAFLHFLKTPPRRTHSDDGMLDGSASGVEDPPARKSTGKFLSLRKGNLRRSKSQDPSATATLNAMTVASSA